MPSSAILIASLLAAVSSPTSPTYVSVDWAGVQGEVIARCELHQLKSTLLERLVQEGFAAVEEPRDDVIRVAIASGRRALTIRVVAAGRALKSKVSAPTSCGKSLMMDAIFVALDLVRRATRLPQPSAEAAPPPVLPPPGGEPPAAAPVPTEPHASELAFTVGATLPGSELALGSVGLALAKRMGWLRLQGELGVDLATKGKLFVFEPAVGFVALVAADVGSLTVLGGPQASAVWHGFRFSSDSGGHMYARVGLPIALTGDVWGLWLIPHLRTIAAKHQLSRGSTWETRFWGVTALVSGKLF